MKKLIIMLTVIAFTLSACGTGYIIEGHVPVSEINRLLKRKAASHWSGGGWDARRLARHGIGGYHPEPYNVILLTAEGSQEVYARYS
jgi:hypothetical protein